MAFVLLLGGARSGKSALAQQVAARTGRPVTVVATAEAGDDEMAARIERHREARPAAWATVEEPLDLLGAVAGAPAGVFLLVDCLTLWVANLAGRGEAPDAIAAAAERVAATLAGRGAGAVVVSNEVGLGIVPANAPARAFRDTLGAVNTAFAGLADRTALLVAGRVLELDSPAALVEGIGWLTRLPDWT